MSGATDVMIDRRRVPLVRLTATSESFVSPSQRAIGSSRCRPFTRLRARSRQHLDNRSPLRRAASSSSPVESPLQSSFARPPASPSRLRLYLPRVFRPHRDITASVHVREDSAPRSVPPSGFLNLSTVCSAFGFAGLFHPAATCRVRSARTEAPAAFLGCGSRFSGSLSGIEP